jgi:Fe-coproporphyrin III synthase
MADTFACGTEALRWMWFSKVLGKKVPMIAGIAINDRCNLRCIHCSVSNRNIPDLDFNEVREGLVQLHSKGMRVLYIEGGEPFIWNDREKGLEDIIGLARKSGFKWIVIYTNGTFPLVSSADTLFVSLDGTKETHNRIRGNTWDRIIANISQSNHPRIYINFTISSLNKHEIELFVKRISEIENIKGINFYFYTPMQTQDFLIINWEEKLGIINNILELKKMGYRIMNSEAALKSLVNDSWKKPDSLGFLYADRKLYKCCRYIQHPESCKNCGYLGFYEMYNISRLNSDSIRTALRYL